MAIEKITDAHKAVGELFGHCLSTFRHSLRVGDELFRFANHLGMRDTDNIYLLGILHDIGKIHIPNSLLNKTSPLTKTEYKKIQLHTEHGQRIVESIVSLPQEYSTIVRFHHENWDSSGYYGLAGTDIPLLSRMIRIIDSYDTMLHGRIYQNSKTQFEVMDEIQSLSGKHYDPQLVREYKNMLQKSYAFELVNGA